MILLEQIRTLDKRRLRERMGHLDDEMIDRVNNAIAVSFGIIIPPAETYIEEEVRPAAVAEVTIAQGTGDVPPQAEG